MDESPSRCEHPVQGLISVANVMTRDCSEDDLGKNLGKICIANLSKDFGARDMFQRPSHSTEVQWQTPRRFATKNGC